jgi:hypothetical protein
MGDEVKALIVPEHEAFEVFDLADEEQIVAEIAGRVTEKFVYTFKQQGKEVTGLSYAGTNWACREYAKHGEIFRCIGKPDVVLDPTDPDYIVVVVTVQRFRVDQETGRETALDSTFGVKRQWRKMKKNRYDEQGNIIGEEIVPDGFFFEKGFSKAIRNGKQALIPTDIIKKLIQEALKMKNAGPARASESKVSPKQAPAGKPSPPPKAEPKAATPPVASGTPAQAAATPPPKAAPEQSAPAPAAAAPAKQDKGTLVQKFIVAAKRCFGTDEKAVEEGLKKLGITVINDLSEEVIIKFGKILQDVPKGKYKVVDDGLRIVDGDGKTVMGQEPKPEPAPASAPAEALPEGEEKLF